MSPEVEAAVERGVKLVLETVSELRADAEAQPPESSPEPMKVDR
jgi:hypothetical protein